MENFENTYNIWEQRRDQLGAAYVDKKLWTKDALIAINLRDHEHLEKLGGMLTCTQHFNATTVNNEQKARLTFNGFIGELMFMLYLNKKKRYFTVSVDQLLVATNGERGLKIKGLSDFNVEGDKVELKTTSKGFDDPKFKDYFNTYWKKACDESADWIVFISLKENRMVALKPYDPAITDYLLKDIPLTRVVDPDFIDMHANAEKLLMSAENCSWSSFLGKFGELERVIG